MKTCPICKARCFDDMEVCYGCMHRFDADEGVGNVPGGDAASAEPQGSTTSGMGAVPGPSGSGMGVQASGDTARKRPSGATHRDVPRVFGAVAPDIDDDDLDVEEPRGVLESHAAKPQAVTPHAAKPQAVTPHAAKLRTREAAPSTAVQKASHAQQAKPVALDDNELQLALGQIAAASLGNGYRLVISVEPV